MKKLVPSVVALLGLAVSSFGGSERLVGTWKSNKGATVAHLRINTRLTPAQIEKISTILGQMVLVIDTNTITMKHRDWNFSTKYKILEENKNTITVEGQDPQTKKLVKTIFDLDGSGKGFWVPDDKIKGFKERFDKIDKE